MLKPTLSALALTPSEAVISAALGTLQQSNLAAICYIILISAA